MGYEIDVLPVGKGEKSGDAIALRFGDLYGSREDQKVVVIDGGYQSDGEALVSHIQKHYGTNEVDLVISTHPDSDHISGLSKVLDELEVKRLWMHLPWKNTDGIAELFKDGRVTDNSIGKKLEDSLNKAHALYDLAVEKSILVEEPFDGRFFGSETARISVIGPTQAYYKELLAKFRGTPEPKEDTFIEKALKLAKKALEWVKESWDFETIDNEDTTSAENNSSAILLFEFDGKKILFTADAGITALEHALDNLFKSSGMETTDCDYYQIPHHGSKRNIGPDLLDRMVGPKLTELEENTKAFVSAAKKGAPKHPSQAVVNAFIRRGAKVLSTQGETLRMHYEAPERGWSKAKSLPYQDEFEE